ncbi:hypothetical protein [Paraburkholderia sp. BL10I2N1]|uniref:hypothetical protein n=1 Tax=Paraburkholderia sp. BL10I2N1 TaxID=1938796 RepID=UPI0010606887|nr:hypothetical protein [Paraburkholderia sp. BL10I2N1]TDN59104.1 hypothetical protein B0G77_8293 [Paraburkholderia sp. BL10I2N1]
MNNPTVSLSVQRKEAQHRHSDMREERASTVAIGRFYACLMQAKVWASQAALSVGLGVSKAHVSRHLKAARLPDEVIKTFGDDRRISFRTIDLLEQLSKEIGEDRLRQHAIQLGMRKDLSPRDILVALATGSASELPSQVVRLSVHRGERYIRLDSPHIRRLSKDLPNLEAKLNLALKLLGFDV